MINGWNNLKLKFLDAYDKSMPTLPEVNFDVLQVYPKVDLRNRDCEYFSISLKGNGSAVGTSINLDNLMVKRNDFDDDMEFDKGLYLSNNEFVILPISSISMSKGSVSFFLKPDYNSYGNKYINQSGSYSYFSITDVNNNMLSFLLRSGFGVKLFVYDGEMQTHFQAVGLEFEKDELLHLAVSWDCNGGIDSTGNSVKIFKNGKEVYSSKVQWQSHNNKGITLFISGPSPYYALYSELVVSAGSTPIFVGNNSSVGGIISDFTIYNYPKNDFSDYLTQFSLADTSLVSADEMIEISADNINFYGVKSGHLPLRLGAVAPGEDGIVFVRTIIPKNITGKEVRTTGLICQWETT